MRIKKNKKVLVAMSGGVDSSVAAALLKRKNYEIVGVFMRFWSPQEGISGPENRCCSLAAQNRARQVAKKMDIPFYVFDFRQEFKKRVVDYFLDEYQAGRTPNPCVVCNKEIKFGLLLEKALKLGVDWVASGHYARGIKNKNEYKLLRGKDKKKDQSYFLWQLSQEQVRRILFPVGGFTKDKVKKMARDFGLPVLDIPESQEICFIQSDLYHFLKEKLGIESGDIIDKQGETLGEHKGLWFYTIGQRQGLGISEKAGPWYVVDKNIEDNQIIVSRDEDDLYSKRLVANQVNWLSGEAPQFPLEVRAQIRYLHPAQPAVVSSFKQKDDQVEVVFNEEQRAITPGQSVVFYKNDELLGGGVIT